MSDNEPQYISVNADLFRIAYGAVSSEATRYYLNGVYVHPHPTKGNGALLVSTDGHRMLVVHDANGRADRAAIIQLSKSALKECRSKSKDERRVVVKLGPNAKGSTARVVSRGTVTVGISEGCEIDGTFPDYGRVVPTKATGPVLAAFNPKYLAEMGSVGTELSKLDGADAGMVIHGSEATDPVLITWGPAHPAFGVLMPMRGDLAGMPAWAPVSEQKSAA